MESLWLSVYPHNSNRSILIGALYRPPSTDKEMDPKTEKNIEVAYLGDSFSRGCERRLLGQKSLL